MATVEGDLQSLICSLRPERTLITTYAASLSYLEAGLLAALRTHGRPAVRVLVDAGPHADCLGEVGIRHHGTRYEVFPVSAAPGYRFHPKTYAFVGNGQATLVVASANLTVPGFRRNWEVFDVFRAGPSADGGATAKDAGVMAQYRGFLERLATAGLHGPPAAINAIREMAHDITEVIGPEVNHASQDGSWLLHSLDQPILDQLVRLMPADEIEKVTAYSPYFDPGAIAVRRVLDAFPKAKRIRVVLDRTSEPAFNGKALRKHVKRLEVLRAEGPSDTQRRFLHAKLMVLTGKSGTWVVAGSANLTAPGLCGAADPSGVAANGNIEVVTVRHIPDSRGARSLLSRVPTTAWPEWLDSDASAAEQEEDRVDADSLRLLDAELEGSVVRCHMAGLKGGAPLENLHIHLEHSAGRVTMEVASVDDQVLEAVCRDPGVVDSDDPARVVVTLTRTGETTLVAKGWLRRPAELRRTAESVSLRERLRPLRLQGTPDADTLIEVHSGLQALLTALARSEEALKVKPGDIGGSERRQPPDKENDRGPGPLISISDLLGDDEGTRGAHDSSGRVRDGLQAISDVLRAHMAGHASGGSSRTPPETEDEGSTSSGAKRRAPRKPDEHRRRPPALTREASSELARLASTFAGAVRAAPLTGDGIRTLLDTAEPVGTALLAANVLRTPADTENERTGLRSTHIDVLVAWWSALLGVAPGPDGQPRGFLVRAWAREELRTELENALQDGASGPAGGLAAIAAGLGFARGLLRMERGSDEALQDSALGLCVLTGTVERPSAMPWADDAKSRLDQAARPWRDQKLADAMTAVWGADIPLRPPFMEDLERWESLRTGEVSTETDLPRQLQVRLCRLRGRYGDPIASFDVQGRRTSCCPETTTHAGFASELAKPWPDLAGCPSCGRIIAPPEIMDGAMRVVSAWIRNAQSMASGVKAPTASPVLGSSTTAVTAT